MPAGDLGLLADLGMHELDLAVLLDDVDLYPDEILSDVARQIDSAEAETKRTSKLHQGEDETFGRRAAAAGHQTWVDFSVICGHVGTKVYNSQNTDAQ